MARVRISTTVADDRLAQARRIADWRNDAEMMDAALGALLAQHRDEQVDAAYAEGYRRAPADAPDEWGDLTSFRDAAARS